MKKKVIIILIAVILCAGTLCGGWIYVHSGHFEQLTATIKQDSVKEKQKKIGKLEGRWVDEDKGYDAALWRDSVDFLHAEITVPDENKNMVMWSFSGKYSEPENGFRYYDGKKEMTALDMDGNAATEILYSNGQGRIFLKNDKLYWEDNEEDAGKDLTFSYEGEY